MKKILTLKTGLHIGAQDDAMKIGGVDSPVLKRKVYCNSEGKVDLSSNIFIEEPYIPGSSLKGKIRSLLEHHFNLHKELLEVYREKEQEFLKVLQQNDISSINNFERLEKKKNKNDNEKEDLAKIKQSQEYNEWSNIKKQIGNPINSDMLQYFNDKSKENAKKIIFMFGESANNTQTNKITIPRVVFRDAFITQYIREKALNEEIELTEEKMENVIDRITSTTKSGGLRQMQRVPAGIEFEVEIVIREFGDNEDYEALIKKGLELLEQDYLGGSGTRGYGQVVFRDENENL